MARIETDCGIGADPTGVALLLAGPAVADLWPAAPAPELATRAAVRVADGDPAPVRTPTSFVSRFRVRVGEQVVQARLTLGYGGPGGGVGATRAVLRLDGEVPVEQLHELGTQFLDRLRQAAESRSRVA